MNDDNLKSSLKNWKIEPPAANLSRRIAAHAVRHKQVMPLAVRLVRALDTAFSDWTYGLAYKVAGIALLAGMGLTLGLAAPQTSGTADDIDIVQLALGGGEG